MTWEIQRDSEAWRHELCQFLGGDKMALTISNALRRSGEVLTVEKLRDVWTSGRYGPEYLLDLRWIGSGSLDRIREKIEGES